MIFCLGLFCPKGLWRLGKNLVLFNLLVNPRSGELYENSLRPFIDVDTRTVTRMTAISKMNPVCVNDHYILAAVQQAHAGPVGFPSVWWIDETLRALMPMTCQDWHSMEKCAAVWIFFHSGCIPSCSLIICKLSYHLWPIDDGILAAISAMHGELVTHWL